MYTQCVNTMTVFYCTSALVHSRTRWRQWWLCVAFGFLCCLLVQDVYETFNILMRRKPKENNFKVCVCVCVHACVCVRGVRVVLGLQAVLETIRALMNAECVVPDWLHDTFLGYGDPSAANYTRYNCTSYMVFGVVSNLVS